MKKETGYAVMIYRQREKRWELCYSWTKPHPEDIDNSNPIYAIYPDEKSAKMDIRFRCGKSKHCKIKKLNLN